MEIKYCGFSTVTNTTNKHSQNIMATIFDSDCYAPYIYIYYNGYTTPLSQASPVFDLLFDRSARPSTQSSIAESQSAVARDVDYPVLIPSCTIIRAMVRVNAWCVRSRL